MTSEPRIFSLTSGRATGSQGWRRSVFTYRLLHDVICLSPLHPPSPPPQPPPFHFVLFWFWLFFFVFCFLRPGFYFLSLCCRTSSTFVSQCGDSRHTLYIFFLCLRTVLPRTKINIPKMLLLFLQAELQIITYLYNFLFFLCGFGLF